MNFVKGFLLKNEWVSAPFSTCSSVKLREAFTKNQTKTDDITIYQVIDKISKGKRYKYFFGITRKEFQENPKSFFILDAGGLFFFFFFSFLTSYIGTAGNYKVDPRH